MEKKFKFVINDDFRIVMGRRLYRIKALRSFGDVKEGDLGGYVESENNLSHEGNCWVYDNARVGGKSKIYGDAKIKNSAVVIHNAEIYENALICGRAFISCNAKVCGNAIICENAKLYGYAYANDNTVIDGNKFIFLPLKHENILKLFIRFLKEENLYEKYSDKTRRKILDILNYDCNPLRINDTYSFSISKKWLEAEDRWDILLEKIQKNENKYTLRRD